ncbi:hypothetical protein [Flavobacterium sp.]
MKTKILFIAFFAMSMLGNAKSNSNSRGNEFCIESLKSISICQTSNAVDEDGNVVLSATCCKYFKTQPSAEDEITIRLSLTLCAEDMIRNTSIY